MTTQNAEHPRATLSHDDWSDWRGRALLVWGVFNPNGPTLNCLGIRERAGGREGEVFHRWLHFTRSETHSLGRIDLESEDIDSVFAAIIGSSFAGDTKGQLLTNIPCFVMAALPDTLDTVFKEPIRSAPGLQAADWGQEMDLLRRFGERLFDRAREEVGNALTALRVEGADPEYLALVEARYAHLAVHRPEGPGESPSAPFHPQLFEEWWRTATDESVVGSALFQIAHAWVGAIHQAGGSIPIAHSFESVRDTMVELACPLWSPDYSSSELARSLGIPEPKGAPEPLGLGEGRQFPLSHVADFLQSTGARIEAVKDGFTWFPEKSSRTTFAVVPLHVQTDDGYLLTEQVECLLRAPWMRDVDDATANEWNRFASVAGFARHPGSGELVLTSKVGIHEGDEAAAVRNYAPIMAMGAASLGWIAERFVRSDFLVSPEHCPYDGVQDPPPVTPDMFASVLESHIKPLGLLGSVSAESITAEFPWEVGAITHMARLPGFRSRLKKALGLSDPEVRKASGRTALIHIRSDIQHPWFGRGVQSTLELPISVDDPNIVELVRDLNTWELETPDLPPYFGAWLVGPRAPMFQTFVPNQLCIPGLVMNLASWSLVRARLVRRWLGEDRGEDGGLPSIWA